jgi:hypothetical protein
MMKWEPLFAQLLKLLIRMDKLKKEDSETTISAADDDQPNEPENDYGGQNTNITNAIK